MPSTDVQSSASRAEEDAASLALPQLKDHVFTQSGWYMKIGDPDRPQNQKMLAFSSSKQPLKDCVKNLDTSDTDNEDILEISSAETVPVSGTIPDNQMTVLLLGVAVINDETAGRSSTKNVKNKVIGNSIRTRSEEYEVDETDILVKVVAQCFFGDKPGRANIQCLALIPETGEEVARPYVIAHDRVFWLHEYRSNAKSERARWRMTSNLVQSITMPRYDPLLHQPLSKNTTRAVLYNRGTVANELRLRLAAFCIHQTDGLMKDFQQTLMAADKDLVQRPESEHLVTLCNIARKPDMVISDMATIEEHDFANGVVTALNDMYHNINLNETEVLEICRGLSAAGKILPYANIRTFCVLWPKLARRQWPNPEQRPTTDGLAGLVRHVDEIATETLDHAPKYDTSLTLYASQAFMFSALEKLKDIADALRSDAKELMDDLGDQVTGERFEGYIDGMSKASDADTVKAMSSMAVKEGIAPIPKRMNVRADSLDEVITIMDQALGSKAGRPPRTRATRQPSTQNQQSAPPTARPPFSTQPQAPSVAQGPAPLVMDSAQMGAFAQQLMAYMQQQGAAAQPSNDNTAASSEPPEHSTGPQGDST